MPQKIVSDWRRIKINRHLIAPPPPPPPPNTSTLLPLLSVFKGAPTLGLFWCGWQPDSCPGDSILHGRVFFTSPHWGRLVHVGPPAAEPRCWNGPRNRGGGGWRCIGLQHNVVDFSGVRLQRYLFFTLTWRFPPSDTLQAKTGAGRPNRVVVRGRFAVYWSNIVALCAWNCPWVTSQSLCGGYIHNFDTHCLYQGQQSQIHSGPTFAGQLMLTCLCSHH